MKILEKSYTNEELNIINNLATECNLLIETASILYSRGYKTASEIDKFFSAGKHNFYSPFLLDGVKEAKERILLAQEEGQTVVVYGDYDADGICATTILYNTLKEMGVDVHAVIPERENGYGLTENSINAVLEGLFPDLLITVDCGISCHDEVEYLKDLGVDVIVTDHHEIPEILPDCTVINCKLKGQEYPFDSLCGAGVSYKLSYALIGEKANKYLDLVTLATVADSMPLISENRDIVTQGLENIKNGVCCKAIKTLIDISSIREITASSLAFGLAPRVNASGRMGDAFSALKMFLSNDDSEIKELALHLAECNVKRQVACEELYDIVKEMLKTTGNYGNVIVLAGKTWNNGILGIVSARITEEYNLPTILFSASGDSLHGSARSIDGINIFEAISSCKDYLIDFGGHAQAAGVTIDKSNVEAFATKLNEYIKTTYSDVVFEKVLEVDAFIKGEFSMRLAKEILLFEPCGQGNKKPTFALNVCAVNARPIKDGSKHLTFNNKFNDFIYFNGLNQIKTLNATSQKVLVFEPNFSIFKGKEYLKGYVRQVVVSSEETLTKNANYLIDLFKKFKNTSDILALEYTAKNDGICQVDFNSLNYTREDFGAIYKEILSQIESGITSYSQFVISQSPYGIESLAFAVSVFDELGFIKQESAKIIVDKTVKKPLTNSLIYQNVLKIIRV